MATDDDDEQGLAVDDKIVQHGEKQKTLSRK